MNLRFLKQLNEDHDKCMSSEELVSYLTLLHKKCSKAAKVEFDGYLEESYGTKGGFGQYCDALAKDKEHYDTVIQHLEALSERVDESSLLALLKGDTSEEDTD